MKNRNVDKPYKNSHLKMSFEFSGYLKFFVLNEKVSKFWILMYSEQGPYRSRRGKVSEISREGIWALDYNFYSVPSGLDLAAVISPVWPDNINKFSNTKFATSLNYSPTKNFNLDKYQPLKIRQ